MDPTKCILPEGIIALDQSNTGIFQTHSSAVAITEGFSQLKSISAEENRLSCQPSIVFISRVTVGFKNTME